MEAAVEPYGVYSILIEPASRRCTVVVWKDQQPLVDGPPSATGTCQWLLLLWACFAFVCLVMWMTHQNQFNCTNTPWCPTGRDEDDVVMASLGTCLCICSLHREAECLRALYSSEGLWKRRENLLPLRWMHPQNSYYFCLHGTFDQPLVTCTPCLRQVARWGRGVWVAWCLCLSLGPHHLLPGSTV